MHLNNFVDPSCKLSAFRWEKYGRFECVCKSQTTILTFSICWKVSMMMKNSIESKLSRNIIQMNQSSVNVWDCGAEILYRELFCFFFVANRCYSFERENRKKREMKNQFTHFYFYLFSIVVVRPHPIIVCILKYNFYLIGYLVRAAAT